MKFAVKFARRAGTAAAAFAGVHRVPLQVRMAAGLVALGSVLALPASAFAQRQEKPIIAGKPGPNEGKRPAGWMTKSQPVAADRKDTLLFVHQGKGYLLVSGPESIVWTPKNVARGTFILEGSLFFRRSGSTFPEGYGVFFGGRNMNTPQAEYTEFLIRNDGAYSVVHHSGAKVVKLKDWTAIAGINPHKGRLDESVLNKFRIIVDANSVQLMVNRTMATGFLRSQVQPDGEFGVHIGNRQAIQIESIGLEKPVAQAGKKGQ